MRTFAIGDVHGCLTALETLLDSLELRATDRLIFLGDYIDRGPNSRGVIEKLIELNAAPQHVFLRGNHDDWMLRARGEYRWFNSWVGEGIGGQQTLQSYGAEESNLAALSLVPESHWEFLGQTRFFFETETEIFVHGSITEQPAIENDAHTLIWRSFWNIAPHPSGKRIVCGHTWQENGLPVDVGFAVCLDTLTIGAGWLSALDVATNQVFQSSEQEQARHFQLGEAP